MFRILIFATLVIYLVDAFVAVPGCSSCSQSRLRQQPDEWSGFNPLSPGSSEPENEWEGFNPLANSGGAKAMIRMRQSAMQELTQDMLVNIKDDDKLQELLETAKTFLLEPLDNDDSLLDQDSIYEPGMTREERYERYRDTMKGRIAKAKRGHLKKLLQTMNDFVLKHE